MNYISKNIKCFSCLLGVVSAAVSHFWSRHLFDINVPRMKTHPQDYDVSVFYFYATTTLVVIIFILLWLVILRCIFDAKSDKIAIYKRFIPFAVIAFIYTANLLIYYPGFWGDETLVFLYALDYLPVYWHNYLTSLYYMVAMTILPLSTAPLLITILVWSGLYAWLYLKLSTLYPESKIKYLVYVIALIPYNIFVTSFSYYAFSYAPFHVFLFAYLFFEWKEKKPIDTSKIVCLSICAAILSIWRGDGVVLIFFMPALIFFAYKQSISTNKLLLYIFFSVLAIVIAGFPQKIGEDKYYHHDYKIINFISPLSIILNREQTYNGADEDLANIGKIIPVNFIKSFPGVSSSYQYWNNMMRNGRMTQTDATEQEQRKFIDAAIGLILNNLDLYAKQRANMFLDACGVGDLYQFEYNLVVKHVATSSLNSFDQESAMALQVINQKQIYKIIGDKSADVVTDQNYLKSARIFQFLIPINMIIMAIASVCAARSRRWLFVTINIILICRMVVVVMLSPAGSPSYYYSVVTAGLVLLVFECAEYQETKRKIINTAV